MRAVVASAGFQILLAATDCYNFGCGGGGYNADLTTGYQIQVSGGWIAVNSAWLLGQGSLTPQYYSLAYQPIPTLQAGSVIRAVCRTDPRGGVDVIVYINNALVLFYQDTTSAPYLQGPVPYGGAGFNFPQVNTAASYVSEGDVGVLYAGAPTAIPASSIISTTSTTSVELQWSASSEPNGVGVYGYQIFRDGQLLTQSPVTGLSYTDLTASPSSTYTYTVQAVDYHWNTTATSVSVSTQPIATNGPYPSATPDGFRTGVKPTGAYWGSGNENIDVMSGNLSFSLPLLSAQARTSWTVPFNLSYNSQLWKEASGAAWALGGDVGVGFGWTLMAGSITPVWSGSTATMYFFKDSTGAEYRLDQNNNNVWSSKESLYVYFDANLDILHFRDGSFWNMGCVSSASEFDSGVMYPTVMEDTNGNQILISYHLGIGATWINSSSRISTIQDVRTSSGSTFTFHYNTDSPVAHLTAITNSISTGEQYTFTYSDNQTIASSISGQLPGTTALLDSATVTGIGVVTTFSYNGGGELTKAVLPYGGYLAWVYDTVAYSSGISYREVQNRYLSKDGVTQTTYPFSHESSVSTPIHQYTMITDPGGVGQKYWTFGQSGVGTGLVTEYQGQQLPGPVVKTQNNFTWSQDSVGNSYISTTLSTLDPTQSYQAQAQTTQTVDTYGNVLQVNKFNYGNLTTPARTYNYTYKSTTTYLSRYILNRLSTASVTIGSTTTPLASNTYDGSFSTVTNPSSNWDTSYASVTTRGNVAQSVTINNTTTYSYNQLGVLASTTSNGVVASVTTSNTNSYAAPTQLAVGSLTTSLSYSSFLGITNATGPNGDSATTYFDSYARPSSTTSPYGATTTYVYNSAPYSSTTPATIKATTNGHWTLTTLDGLGRTVMVQSGDASSTKSQAETVYNSCGCSPNGKLTQQALPHLPTATAAYTIYTYDGIGRTLSVLAPDGASTTNYLYQGNTVKVTDPAGKWKTFTMDVFGHLTQVAEPNPAGGSNYVTSYTYDTWDNLSQVSMPRPSGTQTRTFTYNGKLLMIATNPENGTVSYTYNSYNKIATKTDAKGQVFTYTYDSYARLTGLSVGGTQMETYTYDVSQNSSYSNFSQGRLTAAQYSNNPSAKSTAFIETYGYSQAGLKTNKGLQITQTLTEQDQYGINHSGPATLDLESVYTYDTEGRMTSVQSPGGYYGYGYDTMERLNTMTNLNTSSSIITGATYDPANRPLTISGNLNESRTYNVMGQVTQITSGWNETTMLNVAYNYSTTQNNGKITSQTDNMSGEQIVYAYDALNRLASAGATNSSWGQSYTYDGFGNLLDQTVTAGTAPSLSVVYNAATNQQTTDCADANGNVWGATVGGNCIGALYSYDAKNRISGAAGGTMFYTYAPDNKRVWRYGTDGNGNQTSSEVAFWSVTGKKLFACNLTPGQAVYQNNAYVETLNCPLAGGFPLSFAANAYFGGRLLSNENGNVVQDRLGSIGKFYPWGQEKPSATTNGTEKFTGYIRDAETQLDYADQRYHQSGMGRFLSPDPYMDSVGPTNPGTWNRYAYVGGDPITFKDPTGKALCNPDDPGCSDPVIGCDPYDASCNDLCGPNEFFNPSTGVCQLIPNGPPPGTGGGGGEDSFLATDEADARTDLAKPKCYALLGFASATAAQTWFDKSITFKQASLGKLTLGKGGIPESRPAPASTQGLGQVNINTDYNWGDFSKVSTNTGGTFNYLGYINRQLRTNMNSEQLGTLIIIHELGHQLSAPQQPSDVESAAEKIAIYNDCIK